MKKRILSLFLSVILVMSVMTFTALAEDLTVSLDELDGYTYTITGAEGSSIFGDNVNYGVEQTVINTDSVITLNFPADFIDIWDADNEESVFVPDFYNQDERLTTDAVVVKGDVKVRKDVQSEESYRLEKGDFDVEFFGSGTTIKFNQTGNYFITVGVGFNDADERIAFMEKYADLGDKSGHYIFDIAVRVDMGENPIGFDDDLNYYEEYQEPVYSSEDAYNKSLISIDGIKDLHPFSHYHEGQITYIAYCTSPVTITAQCALDDFSVYPMYYANEGQLLDEKLPLFPDGKKAQDYDWYERHQEIYATEPDIDLVEYVYAQKGEKYTLTKPGYYHANGTIYDEAGNYENDIYTDIVIKITDLNAVYAPSKVLVDGEEYKFEAYNIEGNNYFKLRDIAMLLNKNNAEAQFANVTWDDVNKVVNVIPHQKYVPVGGEFAEGDGTSKLAQYGASELYIDGYPVGVRAYLINGNNYFKLRDLAEIFMFDVDWDAAANSVIIDTLSALNQ